jgi:transcriptional regulator
MHIPKHFEEHSLSEKQGLIRSQPLGSLITHSSAGLNANHIPFVYQDEPGPLGVLQAHVPRFNSLLEDIHSNAEVLVIFHGANGYISPNWYASKKESGKVVPTWNYQVVHVRGTAQIIDDRNWVLAQMESLTAQQEAGFVTPWKIDDAPADYTDKLLNSLLGVEISITRLEGKTKASQNQPAANRASVIAGLSEQGSDNSQALAVQVARKDH